MTTAPKVYPPGAGDVTIKLGDQEIVLKPTLPAALSISRQSGGIRGAIDKVMQLDLDTITAVIRAGIGPKDVKRFNGLDELIYSEGLTENQGELLAKLVEYLANVARGGRPDEPGEGKEEDHPQS